MITSEFEVLFRNHFRSCVFVAEMIVNSREIAEDIVQDVFIKILDKNIQKINSPANFLYVTVRNAAIDYCRTHAVRTRNDVDISDMANIPDDVSGDLAPGEYEHANNVRKLFNAIECLPTQSRNVVKLICLENYSYKDAAKKLGLSVATIKTHMYRSLKTLRSRLSLFA